MKQIKEKKRKNKRQEIEEKKGGTTA